MTAAGPPSHSPPATHPSHPRRLFRVPQLRRFSVRSVQGWLRVVLGVLAVLALATTLAIAQLVAAGRHAAGELENGILPAQAQAYRLQGALLDQETGVRGFAITGNRDFLQPYTSGLATQAAATFRLRALTGGNGQLSGDLAALARAATGWRRSYAQPLIMLAARGPLGRKYIALLDASKASFDHLRSLFSRQNAHLAAAAARDHARVSAGRTDENLAFGIIAGVIVLAVIALTLVLQRAVVQPLGRLRRVTRRVAGGDFGHSIEAAGPTEVRSVAVDVEAMRSALVAALGEARASQETTAQQAADLDAQAADLLRSNAELEQFAYVASHDLQEPLRKVASFCQLLEKRYGDQLDERGLQYIGFAVDGAKRMQGLINDLLTFSRVGRANDARIQLRLDGPLDAAIATLQATIEETGAVIERPAELPEVIGDPTLLGMLWQNLLGNAIKFAAPGRPPVVRISAAGLPGGDMWEFCVQDNGIGIAAEFADKVFVIFQRLHGREAYPGTGIGLAICKRVVEYHGGEIRLDAGFTGGARICFTLPRITAPPEESPA